MKHTLTAYSMQHKTMDCLLQIVSFNPGTTTAGINQTNGCTYTFDLEFQYLPTCNQMFDARHEMLKLSIDNY